MQAALCRSIVETLGQRFQPDIMKAVKRWTTRLSVKRVGVPQVYMQAFLIFFILVDAVIVFLRRGPCPYASVTGSAVVSTAAAAFFADLHSSKALSSGAENFTASPITAMSSSSPRMGTLSGMRSFLLTR